jgi:Protein of unknown function (DUF1488)
MGNGLAEEASLSSDGKLVAFVAHIRGHSVQCTITRSALEQHSWAPVGANGPRLLKAITDGHNRIAAAAERKMLRAPGEPIKLSDTDFSH